MAEIVLSIPNAQVGRVVDALCQVGGYSGTPDDEPSRRDFAKGVLVRHVKQTVMQVEREQAVAAATASVTVDPITVE